MGDPAPRAVAAEVPLLVVEAAMDEIPGVRPSKRARGAAPLGDDAIDGEARAGGAGTGRHGAPSRGRPPARAGGLRCEERAQSHPEQRYRAHPGPATAARPTAPRKRRAVCGMDPDSSDNWGWKVTQ